VAAAQLSDPAFVTVFSNELAAAGIEPAHVELDVPEQALLGSSERGARTLTALDALGVTIVVDAFGTGKASFATLRRYPLRAIKLHGSRVEGVADDVGRRRDVEGVVALGKALGLAVVATGVATAADAVCLGAAGCTALQGPFAPHALAAQACEALLRARRAS
jgi:EAL domain-containing protein (putative c-di-GMP-specific phosphodiesterase class I)